MKSISLRVKPSTSDNETTKEYTCKGKIYDQFCPDVQEFQSAPWTVDVMRAEPIEGPGKYGYVSLLDTLFVVLSLTTTGVCRCSIVYVTGVISYNWCYRPTIKVDCGPMKTHICVT